jgi:hypothetical protein
VVVACWADRGGGGRPGWLGRVGSAQEDQGKKENWAQMSNGCWIFQTPNQALNLNKDNWNQTKLLGSFQEWKIFEFGSNIWNLNEGLSNQNSKIGFELQNKD